MRLAFLSLAGVFVLSGAPSFAQSAKLVQTFDDWQVFVHEAKEEKICFAVSQPKQMEPKAVKRDPAYFYLTTWQKDGVKHEVSIKMGYKIKADSTPVIELGGATYSLYPKDDKAFMRDPGDERRLLDAMKKGADLKVKATSVRGTATTDQYSLRGLTAAVKRVESACP
jgi:invasion protein IalB